MNHVNIEETKNEYSPPAGLTETVNRSVKAFHETNSHNDWGSAFDPVEATQHSKQAAFGKSQQEHMLPVKLIAAEPVMNLQDLSFKKTTFNFVSDDVWGVEETEATQLSDLFQSPFPSVTVEFDGSSVEKLLEMVTTSLTSPTTACSLSQDKKEVQVVSHNSLSRCEYAVSICELANGGTKIEFQLQKGSMSFVKSELTRFHQYLAAQSSVHVRECSSNSKQYDVTVLSAVTPSTAQASLDSSTVQLVVAMASSSLADVQKEGLKTLWSLCSSPADLAALCSERSTILPVLSKILSSTATTDDDICWTTSSILLPMCSDKDVRSAAKLLCPALSALLSRPETVWNKAGLQQIASALDLIAP